MNWAVTGDVGERGPTINLNVFRRLHNTQTKRFLNTVNRIGPCLKEHYPAKLSYVFDKFHAIRTKSWLNTVIWAGPCLREHDQPFIWTLLIVCITSRRKDSSTPRNELGRDRGCWRAAKPSSWMFLKWLHNIQTKRFFNTVKKTGPCLGKHDLAIRLNIFEKFHIIRTKSCFNTVKWAGPWFGEHDQPFIWTLLIVCITSRRKYFWTPETKLGSDKECWGARPSHQLDYFWNGCITSRRKGSLTPWKELGRVWGSTTQLKFWMFLKSFTPSGRKVDSTSWVELDRVWGSTTSRSFERCWKSA